MLTLNLWIKAALLNGALGYVQDIVYRLGTGPPQPPTSMYWFDLIVT